MYLTGADAEAAAGDATITPVVTGQLDCTVLDQLTSVFLKAHGRGPGHHRDHHPGDSPSQDHGGQACQPPSICQVHHLIPRSQGGPTALGNLRLSCRFHHLIVIHRWGWKITCHPDGTTTATSPGGRTLHSHSPPGHAA